MACFCPGKQVCKDEEHYEDESDGLKDEIIREIRNTGLSEHDQEVIKPVFRNTTWELPSQQSKKDGEYESVSNKTSAGKRIGKQHPANELVDNIRQYGSKCHIPVIDPAPDLRHKISECDKYSKCDAEMSEKEHDVLKGLYDIK